MKDEIKLTGEHDKAEQFCDAVAHTAHEMGIEAFVMVIQVGGDKLSMRFPMCDDDCDTPSDCTVRVYQSAAGILTDLALDVSRAGARA